MSVFKFIFKHYIIAFISAGMILGGCSGKIGDPNIPIVQAQKLFSEAQVNVDKKQAYLKYKTACYDGNHYPSCIEAGKMVKDFYLIDEEETPTNYTIQKVKIFQYLCDKDDLDGCQKLLDSWGDEYDLAFPSRGAEIAWGVDLPLIPLTGMLYIFAFLAVKNGTFSARYVASRNKIPDQLKEKIKTIANKQCSENNSQACFVAGDFEKACDLGGLEGCIKLIESSPNRNFSKFNSSKEKACQNGDSTACLELAKLFKIREKNDQAKNFSNKACQAGNDEGCFFYADLQLQSKPKESLMALENMCKNNKGQACGKIFEIAQQYKNTHQNIAKMFSKASCDLESVEGCALYADLHMATDFKEAIKPLKVLCKKDMFACGKIANIFLKRNTKADKLEAIKYLKDALIISKSSIVDYSSSFKEMIEDAQNQIKKIDALQNVKQGCSKNDTQACLQLADSYFNGEKGVVEQDKEKALELYANLCIKNQNIKLCKLAGNIFEQEKRYATADNFYRKSMVLETKMSANKLETPIDTLFMDEQRDCGHWLNTGRAYNRTIECYSKMCQDGSPYACKLTHLIAKEHLQNEGYIKTTYPIKQDYFIAKETFEQNCNNGYGMSCIELSNMYLNGQGVKTNKAKGKELREKGLKLLTKSCSLEDGDSCTYLAGQILISNPQKALTLYIKGCELGFSFACTQAGSIYEKGTKTPKNINKAKDFYGKACDFQDQEGCSLYNRLSR